MDARSIPNPRRLRAKLMLAGTTLRAFAKKNDLPERTVRAAVRGERNGPKSRFIVELIHQL